MRIFIFVFVLFSFTGHSQHDSLTLATKKAITAFNPEEAMDAIEKGMQSWDISEAQIREYDALNVKVLEIAGLNDRVIEVSNALLEKKKYSTIQEIRIRLSRSLAYEILDDPKLCQDEFEKMSELFIKLKDTTNKEYGNYLYRMCSFYRVNDAHAKAFSYVKRSEQHALKYGHEDNLAVTRLLQSFFGDISREQRIRYVQHALSYWKGVKDYHGASSMYASLSRVALQENDFDKAMTFIDSILILPLGDHLDGSKAGAFKIKSEIFERMSLPDSALACYKQYVHFTNLKDHLSQKIKLKELQQSYKTREIKLINDDLRKTKENAELKNKSLVTSLIILGIAILIVTFLLIKLFITQKKQKESNVQLSQALKEKRILLKEVNHRVKNNLSLVINLIKFQESSTENAIARDTLNDLYHRVESMSLAQREILSDKNDNETVSQSMRKYVYDLVTNIVSIDPRKIDLDLHVDDVQLFVNTMIPLGLILNELVSNTLKHTDSDEITIFSTIEIEGENLTLKYKNHPNTSKSNQKEDGMGTFILKGMVEQMNGSIINEQYDYIIQLRIKQ